MTPSADSGSSPNVIQRLVVAPQAEADLRDAFIQYEQRSAGLGRDFLLRIEVAFELISTWPQLSRQGNGPYRLAPTRNFPYSNYFIWDEFIALFPFVGFYTSSKIPLLARDCQKVCRAWSGASPSATP